MVLARSPWVMRLRARIVGANPLRNRRKDMRVQAIHALSPAPALTDHARISQHARMEGQDRAGDSEILVQIGW